MFIYALYGCITVCMCITVCIYYDTFASKCFDLSALFALIECLIYMHIYMAYIESLYLDIP